MFNTQWKSCLRSFHEEEIQACCSNNRWYENTEPQITFSGMNLKLVIL